MKASENQKALLKAVALEVNGWYHSPRFDNEQIQNNVIRDFVGGLARDGMLTREHAPLLLKVLKDLSAAIRHARYSVIEMQEKYPNDLSLKIQAL